MFDGFHTAKRLWDEIFVQTEKVEVFLDDDTECNVIGPGKSDVGERKVLFGGWKLTNVNGSPGSSSEHSRDAICRQPCETQNLHTPPELLCATLDRTS